MAPLRRNQRFITSRELIDRWQISAPDLISILSTGEIRFLDSRTLRSYSYDDKMLDTAYKYMVREAIDHLKLGKWISGWTRRRNLTSEEIRRAKTQAYLLCGRNKITTAADLAKFFKKEKNRIKAIRGRRTDYKSKILKTNYRNFVKRVPYY